jgi:hypothetical protein
VVLLAAAGIGVGLLGRGSDARPLEVAAVRSFDPQGDNRTENEELAPAAIDGDPGTAWRSERYNDPASIAGKDGVGLALTLADPAQLTSIDITTPTGGWAAQVYVVSGTEPQDLAGWGDAVASVSDAGDGTTRLSLRGSTGDGVLIWFTRLAPNGSVEVSDVTVQGR